jgi:hypothetical protein
MEFDLSSLTLEGIASIILAVGLVSVYFFGGNSTSTSEVQPNETTQLSTQDSSESRRKVKKGKNESNQSAQIVEQARLPGGNENFSPTLETNEPSADSPTLIVASGAAAQEHKGKSKKGKKKGKEIAAKQTQDTQNVSEQLPKPKTRPHAGSIAHAVPETENEGEWRVVGRSRKADNTAESQASLTTTSVTDPGSPTLDLGTFDEQKKVTAAFVSKAGKLGKEK